MPSEKFNKDTFFSIMQFLNENIVLEPRQHPIMAKIIWTINLTNSSCEALVLESCFLQVVRDRRQHWSNLCIHRWASQQTKAQHFKSIEKKHKLTTYVTFPHFSQYSDCTETKLDKVYPKADLVWRWVSQCYIHYWTEITWNRTCFWRKQKE